MKTYPQLLLLSLVGQLLAGCAGREDMRNVASQSAAILSQTQAQVDLFNKSETRLNNVIQNNIATFNTMTAEANIAVNTRQASWLDPKMKAIFQEVKSGDSSLYIATANNMTASAPSAPVIAVGTEKIRVAVAKLNALAQNPNLQSQVTFLAEFGKGVKDAYDEKQKKATGLAVDASTKADALNPANTTPALPQ